MGLTLRHPVFSCPENGQSCHFMTKGHYHEWREAARVYIGLHGKGLMLLEDETTNDARLVSLCANEIVYVPGNTAHRTINIGDKPLVYIGCISPPGPGMTSALSPSVTSQALLWNAMGSLLYNNA
ncbi:MAG: glucose-6-phosphate isomerase family protein [Chloroflexota bacterium]